MPADSSTSPHICAWYSEPMLTVGTAGFYMCLSSKPHIVIIGNATSGDAEHEWIGFVRSDVWDNYFHVCKGQNMEGRAGNLYLMQSCMFLSLKTRQLSACHQYQYESREQVLPYRVKTLLSGLKHVPVSQKSVFLQSDKWGRHEITCYFCLCNL